MAVSVGNLAVSLRLVADSTDTVDAGTAEMLTRLIGAGDALLATTAPDAPDAIKDQALIQFASYVYDQPLGRRDAYAHAWGNSGAGALVMPWLGNLRIPGNA